MATRGQSKYMLHIRQRLAKITPIVTGSYKSETLQRHEQMEVKAKTNEAKGRRGGDCNRTQCQRSDAWWYNKTMRAYYCGNCAGAINESCLFKDHIVSFGSMIYVNPPTVRTDEFEEDGEYRVMITTADGETSGYAIAYTKESAEQDFRAACSDLDLRSDGSPPYHYGELREKMLKIRALIQERYPNEELVEFV